MQIIIEIPDEDIPKHQAIIEIPLHFVHGGKICEAGGYGFEVLPKGHGRLIDADELDRKMKAYNSGRGFYYSGLPYVSTIIWK